MPAAAESLPQTAPLHCVVCGADTPASQVTTGTIRSNIRKFKDERFSLWQCPRCRTVHAADEVDLDYYYAHYPFHDQVMNLPTKLAYMGKVRELVKLGLKKEHRVLDYGSGGGVFVELLQQQGYNARGYDPYAKAGPHREPPGTGYDVVLSQDVIEHVASPLEHLQTLQQLAVPGALIFLGTPNGALIDLKHPDEYIHMLHQPYHRHILTAETIGKLAESIGMRFEKANYGFYGNRVWVPGLNGRFLRRVLRAQGDVLDDMVAGKTPMDASLFTPPAIWDAIFGGYNDPGYDMTVVLRNG